VAAPHCSFNKERTVRPGRESAGPELPVRPLSSAGLVIFPHNGTSDMQGDPPTVGALPGLSVPFFFCFGFFVVLGFELRAFTLSPSISPFL
jgi:hypothetical protein